MTVFRIGKIRSIEGASLATSPEIPRDELDTASLYDLCAPWPTRMLM